MSEEELIEVIRKFIEEWDEAQRDAEEMVNELRDVVAEYERENG